MYVVHYTDEFSAINEETGKKSSYTDLQISITNRIIGCGSKKFRLASPGDLVILVANLEGRPRDIIFYIGVIGASRTKEESHQWFNNGGKVWDYNFVFTPLTGIIRRRDWDSVIRRICVKYNVNYSCILSSRLGSQKNIRPFLRGMLTIPEFLIPPAIE